MVPLHSLHEYLWGTPSGRNRSHPQLHPLGVPPLPVCIPLPLPVCLPASLPIFSSASLPPFTLTSSCSFYRRALWGGWLILR